MPIEISWYDSEKTIMFGQFIGDWTWQDYSMSLIATMELADGIDYRLDQIIDMTASGPIPLGQALTHVKRSTDFSKSLRIGLTIFIGRSPILQGLITAAAITNPQRSPRLFADSIEEAYALIQADRVKK